MTRVRAFPKQTAHGSSNASRGSSVSGSRGAGVGTGLGLALVREHVRLHGADASSSPTRRRAARDLSSRSPWHRGRPWSKTACRQAAKSNDDKTTTPIDGGAVRPGDRRCNGRMRGCDPADRAQPIAVPNLFHVPTVPDLLRHGRPVDVYFLTRGHLVASTRYVPAGKLTLDRLLQDTLNALTFGPTTSELHSGIFTAMSEFPRAQLHAHRQCEGGRRFRRPGLVVRFARRDRTVPSRRPDRLHAHPVHPGQIRQLPLRRRTGGVPRPG